MDYTPQSTGVLEPRPPRLLDHVRERIRLRHYSIRTEQACVGWVRRFILANDRRHPRELGPGGRGVPYPPGDAGQCGGGYAADDETGKMTCSSLRMGMRWSFMVAGQWGDGGRCPDWMALPHGGATYRSTCAPRRCSTVGWISLLSFTTWSSDSPSRPCGVLRCLLEVHA